MVFKMAHFRKSTGPRWVKISVTAVSVIHREPIVHSGTACDKLHLANDGIINSRNMFFVFSVILLTRIAFYTTKEHTATLTNVANQVQQDNVIKQSRRV